MEVRFHHVPQRLHRTVPQLTDKGRIDGAALESKVKEMIHNFLDKSLLEDLTLRDLRHHLEKKLGLNLRCKKPLIRSTVALYMKRYKKRKGGTTTTTTTTTTTNASSDSLSGKTALMSKSKNSDMIPVGFNLKGRFTSYTEFISAIAKHGGIDVVRQDDLWWDVLEELHGSVSRQWRGLPAFLNRWYVKLTLEIGTGKGEVKGRRKDRKRQTIAVQRKTNVEAESASKLRYCRVKRGPHQERQQFAETASDPLT